MCFFSEISCFLNLILLYYYHEKLGVKSFGKKTNETQKQKRR